MVCPAMVSHDDDAQSKELSQANSIFKNLPNHWQIDEKFKLKYNFYDTPYMSQINCRL